jgi:hypothetical protein
VDDLIDLEQQAEFFMVLGDEGAAVDLLQSHLRSTGGRSPLPYLKLLAIYRRRGEHEAHERLRQRFNPRFGVVAPGWDADPEQGRDLLDYPAALAALQACWQQPSHAMAELEALLFHEGGGEPLELPACRDLLSLYSVARDLRRQADQPTPDIDLLLPLSAGDELALDAPISIFDTLAAGNAGQALLPQQPPRAAVDVDLDLSEPPARQDSRPGALEPLRATLRRD